jgi:peptidoglycan-associated lipoprotein
VVTHGRGKIGENNLLIRKEVKSMKKRWIHLAVILAVLAFVGACICQPQVVKPKEEPAKVAPPEKKAEEPEVAPKPAEVKEAEVKEEAKEVSPLEDIYFAFDDYSLTDPAKATLEKNAAWMKNNLNTKVRIEGNCDERGTNEYNMALGERRANSAKKYLINLGVKESQLSIVSYGEEKPVCTEHNEECWTKNRRDHFAIVK